jgi:hypothetical protein
MVGFGFVIVIGIVIISMSVSVVLFWDDQTISKFSEYSNEIKVGNVKFDVQYVTNYEILEKEKAQQEFQELYIETGPNPNLLNKSSEIPEGVYFQIQITANNTGNETVELTGGNFFLYDINNKKHEAKFIGYGENELTVLELEPNNPITVTTQFDIQYDDEMKYTVGIIPNKYGLQDSQERAFICIKNC